MSPCVRPYSTLPSVETEELSLQVIPVQNGPPAPPNMADRGARAAAALCLSVSFHLLRRLILFFYKLLILIAAVDESGRLNLNNSVPLYGRRQPCRVCIFHAATHLGHYQIDSDSN